VLARLGDIRRVTRAVGGVLASRPRRDVVSGALAVV
jgi:hypothetical protein